MKMEYKPILESIYIIYRSFNNQSRSFDIWSEPIVLNSIKYNDLNKISEVRRAFKNPKPSENFGFKEVDFQIGDLIFCKQFPSERTQVKICLPAGTILETFNI